MRFMNHMEVVVVLMRRLVSSVRRIDIRIGAELHYGCESIERWVGGVI